MAGKVKRRVTLNLTEAQYDAWKTTMQAIRETNDSDVLRSLVAEFVNVFGPGWPHEEIKWGGARPLKNGGSEEIQE